MQHCERGLLDLLPQSGTPRDTRIDFMGIASFLAATDSGVLAAAPASSDTPNVLTRVVDLPSARSQEQGRAPSLLFEVSDGWVVRGLAASGSHRLCVISSEDPTDISSYIGLWDEASSSSHVPTRWIHVLSPTPVVALAGDTVAWGAGSQQDNAQMYVMRWTDSQPFLAGEAPGYSRPALSPSGTTVAIPRVSSSSATSWVIGEFRP